MHARAAVASSAADSSGQKPADAPVRGSELLEALSAAQKAQLDQYLDRLLEVNQSLNLTAIRNKEDAYERHVGDSLAALPVLDEALELARADGEGSAAGARPRVMDVGSGGGLPGLLLAIARPEWDLTLLDTLRKRIDFINETVEHLGLTNAHGLWARAEDAGKNANGLLERETYDVVTARAVAEMRVLAELCLPMVRVGGYLVAYKGAEPSEEVEAAQNAITLLGGELVRVERVGSRAPMGSNKGTPEGDRTAVLIRKVAATPAKYPRRPGMPNKRPL